MLVGVLERGGHAVRYPEDLARVQAAVLCLGKPAVERPAPHVLADDERLAGLVADVVDRDDVRVVAEPGHRLRLTVDALARGSVQALCLQHRDRDVPVEARIVCEIHPLATALAEEALHDVAAAGDLLRILAPRCAVRRGRGRAGWPLDRPIASVHGRRRVAFGAETLAASRAEAQVGGTRAPAIRAALLADERASAAAAEVRVGGILVAALAARHAPEFAMRPSPAE